MREQRDAICLKMEHIVDYVLYFWTSNATLGCQSKAVIASVRSDGRFAHEPK